MQNPDLRAEQSLMPVVARWADQDKGMLLPIFRLIATGEPLTAAHFANESISKSGAYGAELGRSLANIDSLGRIIDCVRIV